MKRTFVLILSLALAGCGALPSSAPAASADTATPVVVVETVLVTVVPTQGAAEVPTQTTAPQVIVVTATAGEASMANTAVATVPPEQATAPLPPNPGGDIFTNLTRSGDKLSLRCQPDTLSFGVSTSNPYVTSVDFYFRMEDRLSVSISTWQFGGSMVSDKQGNFTIAFPSSRVDPDLRSHKAWFDYQFVGVNKLGDAVGRSAKISKQVTYTIDCTD